MVSLVHAMTVDAKIGWHYEILLARKPPIINSKTCLNDRNNWMEKQLKIFLIQLPARLRNMNYVPCAPAK